jgi:hypothetical protein
MASEFELRQRQRLKDDFEFYARNCLFIRTKEGAVEPLTLNDAQKYIHQCIEAQRKDTGKVRAIILKGRQQGCSTYVEGRFYHKTTHRNGFRTFILTHEAEATSNLFAMVDRYHQNCPEHIRPVVGATNARELVFANLDSDYKIGTAGNKSVGRSQTIQLFHGSEVAFWANGDEHTKGVMQAVPDMPDTEIILESTANGMGNFFHQQWKKAEAHESEYIAIFVPWFWQSEYTKAIPAGFSLTEDEAILAKQYKLTDGQMYWRRIKIAELSSNGTNGERAFKQEYPNNAAEAFQITGKDGLITPEIILQARKNKVKGSGPLIVGVDPSRGGDRFSIMKRQGRKMYGKESYVADEVNTLGKAVAKCKRVLDTVCPLAGRLPDMMFIDAGGGADLVDRLHELGYRKRVQAVAFGSSAFEPHKWKNKRAEIWGTMNLWMRNEHYPVQIPDDDSLHADLSASFYTRDSNDVIQLWPKEKIKEEIGFSPDEGDAAALTFSEPPEYFEEEDDYEDPMAESGRSSIGGY